MLLRLQLEINKHIFPIQYSMEEKDYVLYDINLDNKYHIPLPINADSVKI